MFEPNPDQLNEILKHLFKRDEHRKLVRDMVTQHISAYESERRNNVAKGTGARKYKTYSNHITYLDNLNKK